MGVRIIILTTLNLAAIRWQRRDIKGMRELAEQTLDILKGIPSLDSLDEAKHLLGRAYRFMGLFYSQSIGPDYNRSKQYFNMGLDQLQQLATKFKGAKDGDWRWLRSLARLNEYMGDLLLTNRNEINDANKYYNANIDTLSYVKRLGFSGLSDVNEPEVNF